MLVLKTQESWSNPQNSDSQIIAVNKKIKNRNIISKDLVEYWRLKENESETSGFKEDIVISCSMTWRHWKCRDVYIPMNHLYGPTTPTLSESDKKNSPLSCNKCDILQTRHTFWPAARLFISHHDISIKRASPIRITSHGDVLSSSVCSTLGILTSTHYDNTKTGIYYM